MSHKIYMSIFFEIRHKNHPPFSYKLIKLCQNLIHKSPKLEYFASVRWLSMGIMIMIIMIFVSSIDET